MAEAFVTTSVLGRWACGRIDDDEEGVLAHDGRADRRDRRGRLRGTAGSRAGRAAGGGAPAGRRAVRPGAAASRVERGKTTQVELLELFGGPNISTVDAEGNETWVYERSVSQTDVASQSQNLRGAVGLDVFFGAGAFGGRAGAPGEAGRTTSQVQTTSSVRTLTVIVKFNKDRTVKDYAARASQF